MTIISALVNKFLTLIGATEVAATESSSNILFTILAIVFIGSGILTIANRKPYLNKYKEYTAESVAEASTILGISDILIGVFDIFVGVLKLDTIPNFVIYAGAGFAVAALIVVQTIVNKKLVKKQNKLIV